MVACYLLRMRLPWLASAALVCAGCQAVVPLDARPDATAAPSTPWGCVDSLAQPSADYGATTHLRWRYVTYSSDTCRHEQPLPTLAVKACRLADTQCATPAFQGMTDCDGYIDLDLPVGFVGYLELTPPRPIDGGEEWAPSVRACFERAGAFVDANARRCRDGANGGVFTPLPSDLMPALEMLSIVTREEPRAEIAVRDASPIFSRQTVAQLALLVGEKLDDNTAHFLGVAFDCNGEWAAGVQVKALNLASGRQFYTDAQDTPSASRTETAVAGTVGFVNIDLGSAEVGALSLEATRVATNQVVGLHEVLLKRGHFTLAELRPRSR